MAKATNTFFETKEEKELADKANLKSLSTRATVEEIANDSLNEDGSLDKEKFSKAVNKRYKKITKGEVFDQLVEHVSSKFSS